jgi:hypothetical protein
METQTEPYLQEVLEKAAETEAATQTDNFLDRPSTPPYFPAKTGVDAETQAEQSRVFEWDFEVQPIVSTIVVKTLEQAFLEVHEEAELANVRRHKEAIEHRRNVELADVQRLEEGELRKFEEKQRRIEERLAYEAAQKELRAKIAARGFGDFFASDLMGDAISLLERRGYFYDEVEREIKERFLPWLGKSMEEASETHRLTLAIIERTKKATLEYEAHLRNQTAEKFDVQAADERISGLARLRQMLVEDLGSTKIRNARAAVKPKDKQPEEEDQSAPEN